MGSSRDHPALPPLLRGRGGELGSQGFVPGSQEHARHADRPGVLAPPLGNPRHAEGVQPVPESVRRARKAGREPRRWIRSRGGPSQGRDEDPKEVTQEITIEILSEPGYRAEDLQFTLTISDAENATLGATQMTVIAVRNVHMPAPAPGSYSHMSMGYTHIWPYAHVLYLYMVI